MSNKAFVVTCDNCVDDLCIANCCYSIEHSDHCECESGVPDWFCSQECHDEYWDDYLEEFEENQNG